MPSKSHNSFSSASRQIIFKPLKTYFQKACQIWISSHKERKIGHLQFGALLSDAWFKAANVGNGVSGFQACGIFPFDPNKVPDHAFSISDASMATARIEPSLLASQNSFVQPEPCCSHLPPAITSGRDKSPVSPLINDVTPTKHLHKISPIPTVPVRINESHQQHAVEITSDHYQDQCHSKQLKKARKMSCRKALHMPLAKKKINIGADRNLNDSPSTHSQMTNSKLWLKLSKIITSVTLQWQIIEGYFWMQIKISA